jgi:hypothetical protein
MHSESFKGSISGYASLNKKLKECSAITNIYGIDKKQNTTSGSFSKKTKDEKIESREIDLTNWKNTPVKQ